MVSVSQSVSCAQKEPKPNFKDGGRQMENHFKSIRLERSFKIKKVLTFLRIQISFFPFEWANPDLFSVQLTHLKLIRTGFRPRNCDFRSKL